MGQSSPPNVTNSFESEEPDSSDGVSRLEMLPKRLRSAEDQFNDRVRDLGTGQEEFGYGAFCAELSLSA